jgi:hypothetical protein
MDYRTHLLDLAETYSAATGRSIARLSTICRNDGKFFKSLRGGAGCTMDTYCRTLNWFAVNWPPGVAWPKGVPRPEVDRRKAS